MLAWVLGVCGLIGLLAAFTLTVEKFELATDPDYTPSCSINPIVNCGSVMDTPQASVFGFPNSLLGIAGFAALVAVAALMGRRPARWVMVGLQVGMTAALVFVHWLIFQSLYRIDALCPYCMAVWVVVVVAFWYVSLRTADEYCPHTGPPRRVLELLVSVHSVPPVLWILVVVALIAERFWWYWSTLL
ncbi:vitamin K epoxide reductase family protein [Williamsia sp. 1135]|uniref:vitamin K epoxide reductase family protein n=1 Tax=Williamsia sp. 1135 TaxID=1889262 RepID=UPI000A0FB066|nr:vitamin K epoxide reductase family protein [Williamsia sp. 1135]ORM35542.1 Vitamin K epoxide reductase [Williamsia sp. 1135]